MFQRQESIRVEGEGRQESEGGDEETVMHQNTVPRTGYFKVHPVFKTMLMPPKCKQPLINWGERNGT